MTTHVKYGDQGITIHGWIINIIIKGGAKSGRHTHNITIGGQIIIF